MKTLHALPSAFSLPGLPYVVDSWCSPPAELQFLTHAHKDHCCGIEGAARHIVCSSLTRELAMLKFPSLGQGHVQWTLLEPGETQHFDGHDGRVPFSVSAFDANHCPGALVLLFHSPVFGTILHTGDMRATQEMCGELRGLLHDLGVERLDLAHLDATFAAETHEFPTRAASCNMLSNLLLQGGYTRAYVCAEGLGSEDLITHLHHVSRQPLHFPPAAPSAAPGPQYPLAEQPQGHSHKQGSSQEQSNGQAEDGGMKGSKHGAVYTGCITNCVRDACFTSKKLHREREEELKLLQRRGVIPASALTDDPNATWHLMGGQRMSDFAQNLPPGQVVIKVSTQRICRARQNAAEGTHASRAALPRSAPAGPVLDVGCHFILSSMHSSRSELQMLLRELRPRAVLPHSGCLDASLSGLMEDTAEDVMDAMRQALALAATTQVGPHMSGCVRVKDEGAAGEVGLVREAAAQAGCRQQLSHAEQQGQGGCMTTSDATNIAGGDGIGHGMCGKRSRDAFDGAVGSSWVGSGPAAHTPGRHVRQPMSRLPSTGLPSVVQHEPGQEQSSRAAGQQQQHAGPRCFVRQLLARAICHSREHGMDPPVPTVVRLHWLKKWSVM